MQRLFLLLSIFGVFQVKAEKVSPACPEDTVNTALFGLYGIVNSPIDQLANTGYLPGGGAGIDWFSKNLISRKNQNLNLKLGLSMFYAGQGGVTNSVYLHDPLGAPGTQTLHNNLFGLDFRSKIIYDKHTFRPYIDLFAGIRNYSTAQTLTIDTPVYGYQRRTRTTELTSEVFSYGTSFGFLIKLSDDVFLDFKATRTISDSPVSFVDFNHMAYDGYMYKVKGPSVMPVMASFQGGIVFRINSGIAPATTSYSYNYYTGNRSTTYHRSTYHNSGRSCGGGRALR